MDPTQERMNQNLFRVLLLADTHIGFDFPLHARVERRRRGHDFLANFRLALQPALRHEVDAVVHGGDLFDRSRVPDALVQIALEPLVEAAQAGVPVFLVPGNHERGKIPFQLWRCHPNFHIFDQPGSVLISKNGLDIRVCGFPFTRKIQGLFTQMTAKTGLNGGADIQLLCMHQAVEGAQVGPADYTFRSGIDVIRARDLPGRTAAVLSGHIHRSQVLRRDLSGRVCPAPVVYPGSVERTAFAEQKERKGYLILDLEPHTESGGRLSRVHFMPLPARPMHTLEIEPASFTPSALLESLRSQIAVLEPDAVVRIRLKGSLSDGDWKVLSAASIRSIHPPTMNVELSGIRREPEGLPTRE